MSIILGDCIQEMSKLPSQSIDMILTDLPYGTSACSWDTVIPFQPMWEQFKRLIKDNGAIVLTASQPFTSALVMSNLDMFRYSMVWEKDRPSDFGNANIKPMRYHEDICIFYKHTPPYTKHFKKRNGSGSERVKYPCKNGIHEGRKNEHRYGCKEQVKTYDEEKINGTVISIPIEIRVTGQHPTQKPVALFEYLIETYTLEGATILDCCAGSGTVAVACIKLNRNYIVIEKEEKYIQMIKERVSKTTVPLFALNANQKSSNEVEQK